MLAIAALAFAASAQASPPETYFAKAAAYWHVPEKSCAYVVWGTLDGEAGHARLNGCEITIDWAEWKATDAARHCDLIVHEYGHLLGHLHGDGDPIMERIRDQITPACNLPLGRKGHRFRAQHLGRASQPRVQSPRARRARQPVDRAAWR